MNNMPIAKTARTPPSYLQVVAKRLALDIYSELHVTALLITCFPLPPTALLLHDVTDRC